MVMIFITGIGVGIILGIILTALLGAGGGEG